jgi:hypothetical protein
MLIERIQNRWYTAAARQRNVSIMLLWSTLIFCIKASDGGSAGCP